MLTDTISLLQIVFCEFEKQQLLRKGENWIVAQIHKEQGLNAKRSVVDPVG